MDVFKDKYLTCIECHKKFLFNVGEQKFYLQKGLITPKRCPSCRAARKALINKEATK
jgi:rubrerythrin